MLRGRPGASAGALPGGAPRYGINTMNDNNICMISIITI